MYLQVLYNIVNILNFTDYSYEASLYEDTVRFGVRTTTARYVRHKINDFHSFLWTKNNNGFKQNKKNQIKRFPQEP